MESIASLDKLDSVAETILESVGENAIVLLYGNLAAGKTTIVSKIAQALGEGSATSPTFSLQHCYGQKMYHYDFYRIDFDEIVALGLIDEFEKSGLHFIEWADDRLRELLVDAGFNVFELRIEAVTQQERKYRLRALDA